MTIEAEVLLSEPRPGVRQITVNRPAKLNAMNLTLAAIDLENRTQVMVGQTEDASEAMHAFLEKRPPKYQNK